MEKMPLISVIVPVYNTSKFLKKCFDSLLHQTYTNLEFIIVNDASTDDSEEIIKEYARKNPKFILVKHEKNRGLFQARLTGFEASKGEYIAFLDSDDCVCSDYYRKMFRTIQEKNADICLTDWAFDFNDGSKKIYRNSELRCSDFEYSKDQILDKFLGGHDYDFSWQVVWNKLVKREVIEKSLADLKEFSEKSGHLIMCEDIAYSLTFYLNSNKVVNCHDVHLYYYKGSENSTTITTEKKFEKSLSDIVKVLDYMGHILSKNNLLEKYQKDYDEFKNFYYKVYYDISKNFGFEKTYQKHVTAKLNKKERIAIDAVQPYEEFDDSYKKYEKIIAEICSAKTKVVSFDIFDTLIMRNVYRPIDVFVILGQEFASELTNGPFVKFDAMRSKAEALSRNKSNNWETTLDEIYDYMVKHFFLDEDLAKRIKKREIELEYKLLRRRETAYNLYDIAKLNGKKVVFTSDMYLPKNAICSFLKKNGYDTNDTMYLSCEHQKNKWHGDLFKEMLKREKVKPEQVVHIGDNYYADVEMARKIGIHSFHLQKTIELFEQNILNEMIYSHPAGYDLRNIDFLGTRALYSIVANKLFDFPFVKKTSIFQGDAKVVGYYAVGMYLYAFTRWIAEEANDAKCLHFVARDGYLPLKAYEIMKEKIKSDLPESDYFFMSRKFLFPLAIKEPKDFICAMNLINVWGHSIDKVVSYFPKDCLNTSYIESLSNQKSKQKFDGYEGYLMNVETIAKCINFEKLKDYHKQIKKFMSKNLSNGDYIVDIGYSGRAESIMKETCDINLNSLYIHANSDSLPFYQRKYGFKNKCFYEYKPKVTGALRELIFMKKEASFIRYDFDGDKVKKVFDEKYVCKENESAIIDIVQHNALLFVEDVCNALGEFFDLIKTNKMVIVQPWEYYLHNSCDFDKNIFASFVFEDDIGLGKINLIEDWKDQNYNSFSNYGGNYVYKKPNLIVRIGNKLFPVGTRRRARLKRLANKLAPSGSKRRKFCKKLVGRK